MKRRNISLLAASMIAPEEIKDLLAIQHSEYSHVSTKHRKRGRAPSLSDDDNIAVHDDTWNYALLLILYTIQGIPMGLSASIPFLIQQKMKITAEASDAGSTNSLRQGPSRLSYDANAIFALSSWPFSLKLLWAPIVDAIYFPSWGRRKSWLLPVQLCAGVVMVLGANFVESQLSISSDSRLATNMRTKSSAEMFSFSPMNTINIAGVTSFFFLLYFLMATQDIAVDGWALTMLSKTNRGRGPLCNSIGQNIGYFLSFTGFLALNDPESAETLWRPLFRWPSKPGAGLISLGGFIRAMGMLILLTTVMVAWLKPEVPSKFVNAEVEAILVKPPTQRPSSSTSMNEDLLDARMGCVETYRRLWEICRLSSVRVLFFILMTYRLPTSLSDNAKFLKAVELGLPKSTTAILSPTVILPLGIITPIVANRVWHGHPLQQFLIAYFIRVTIVPLLDIMMLLVIRQRYDASSKLTTPVMSMLGDSVGFFWFFVISSTAVQAIVQSLQFNAQMTFFASRADPAIGGSYMTLLNTAANMGGTWPSSVVLLLLGRLTRSCQKNTLGNIWCSIGGIGDPYFVVQIVFATLGCLWILSFRKLLDWVASLPEDAWKTHIPESKTRRESFLDIEAAINGDAVTAAVHRSTSKRE